MASATMCFSGFSRDEIAQIQQQFDQANGETGNRWVQASEAEARVLVIDMDSMYGHMTWLKARDSGKTTVGLTAGDRSETDLLLKRPTSVASLKNLLARLEAHTPIAVTVAIPAAAAPAGEPAPPQAAPEPQEPARANPSADYIAAVTTGQMAAMQPVVAHEPRVSDYMAGSFLRGTARLHVAGAPVLAFDPATQTYAGSATLKPLLPYINAVIRESDFEAIDQAEFERIMAGAGGAQPYMRLLWLSGLTVGNGHLLPGYSPARKFVLTKWPQIEREYPKHFRLATVMMKGPAFVREIAEASGVTESEVIDFVNAGLLTGSVVLEGSPSAAGDVPRAVALLAKPRPA